MSIAAGVVCPHQGAFDSCLQPMFLAPLSPPSPPGPQRCVLSSTAAGVDLLGRQSIFCAQCLHIVALLYPAWVSGHLSSGGRVLPGAVCVRWMLCGWSSRLRNACCYGLLTSRVVLVCLFAACRARLAHRRHTAGCGGAAARVAATNFGCVCAAVYKITRGYSAGAAGAACHVLFALPLLVISHPTCNVSTCGICMRLFLCVFLVAGRQMPPPCLSLAAP